MCLSGATQGAEVVHCQSHHLVEIRLRDCWLKQRVWIAGGCVSGSVSGEGIHAAPISGLRLGTELPRGKKSSESIMPQPLMCLAYVQQLETSCLKLVQLELELDRTGKQVAYGGSSSLIWWGYWARNCFWEGVFVGETRISSPISNLYRAVSIYP